MSSLEQQKNSFKARMLAQPTIKKVDLSLDDEPPSKKSKILPAVVESNTISGFTRQLYDVIQLLKTEPDPIGQSEMVRKLAFDVFKSEELMETLKDHERLIFNEQEKTFAYRHVYNIRSKQDLLDLLKKNREYGGLDYKKIKESYPGLNAPLQELEDEGNVYVLRNQKDNAPRMIFYNDALMNIPMDDEFKEMWNQVDIPKSRAELEIQLEKNGLKSMSVIKEKVIKNQGGPKMKSKRKNGRAKITNTHLEGVSLN